MPDLLVERSDSYAIVTLNRPEKRNALSIALRDAVSDALDKLAADETIKTVVLTGAGDVFSAGFDLREFDRALTDEEYSRTLWASSDRYHQTVLQFPLPTIAAVNGPALAGGFDLAVMCDLRVASTTARFAHPERAFGDVVYGPLHDLVGGAVARDVCLGGCELDASAALAVHLVNEVVEPARLMDAVLATVARVTVAPREVMMRTKAKALRCAALSADSATLEL